MEYIYIYIYIYILLECLEAYIKMNENERNIGGK
jgi:hypothetical protein